MAGHITEVYFRAWKKATGDVQEEIETSCVQDFMQNAIFLRRMSPVHTKVRQVDLLYSVSFWRSHLYSKNASFFLTDCELFPLQEGLSQGGQDALSPL